MYDKVLDQDLSDKKIHYALEWWEHKRKLYNIVVISTAIIISIIGAVWDKIAFAHVLFDTFEVIIWIIGANIFYCLGLSFDLVIAYYRKKESQKIRLFIFSVGLAFSVLWTIVGVALNSFY